MVSTTDIKNNFQYDVPENSDLTVTYSFDLSSSEYENPILFTGKSSIQNEAIFISALGNWERILSEIEFEENNSDPSIVFF